MRRGTRRYFAFALPLKSMAQAWQAQTIWRVEVNQMFVIGGNSALHISQRSTTARWRTNLRSTAKGVGELPISDCRLPISESSFP